MADELAWTNRRPRALLRAKREGEKGKKELPDGTRGGLPVEAHPADAGATVHELLETEKGFTDCWEEKTGWASLKRI